MGMFDIDPHGNASLSSPAYYEQEKMASMGQYKRRTFKETILDQIVAHKAKIDELQAVIDSMTPEVEKFVEAMQKARL